jgi:hypothetical protein
MNCRRYYYVCVNDSETTGVRYLLYQKFPVYNKGLGIGTTYMQESFHYPFGIGSLLAPDVSPNPLQFGDGGCHETHVF